MSSVGTTPVLLGTGGTLVQNLGPDDLYVGRGNTVTTLIGYKLVSGESIALGSVSGSQFYAISEGTSEMRTLQGGTSSSAASAAPA